MKILFVNDNSTLVGGAETHIKVLYEEMKRMGHEIHLFSIMSDPIAGHILPISNTVLSKTKPSPMHRIKNRGAAREIMELIKDRQIDVIHAHNVFSGISPYFFKKIKGIGLPSFMTLHDYHVICPKTIIYRRNNRSICLNNSEDMCNMISCDLLKCQGTSKYIYHKIKKKHWAEYLDRVNYIAPSRFMKAIMEGNQIGQVSLIYNGVPTNSSPKTIQSQIRKNNKFWLLFTGRLYPEKGIDVLLKGFEKFLLNIDADGRENIKLFITGKGPQEKLVREYSVKHKEINYLGFVSEERLKELQRDASLILVPSLWPENCSMAILEAMAMGKPLMTSDLGGNPELVINGCNGYLLKFNNIYRSMKLPNSKLKKIPIEPFAEEVCRLLTKAFDESEVFDTLSKNSLKRINGHFSSKQMVARVLGLYTE